MIQTVILNNVQIHKHLELNFSKGVNVLIGPTDSGKSTVIRALNLALNNLPRGGEKIYLTDGAEDPLEIILIDDKGNSIRRMSRTYWVNEGNPLSAFNQDKPEAVAEIIRVNEVNFQLQIAPHFLILETGGNAAKILNSVTGMEDQMLLLAEIKSRMILTRKNHIDLANEKQQVGLIVNQLSTVPIFIQRFNSIVEQQATLQVTSKWIDELDKCVSEAHALSYTFNSLAFLDDLELKFTKIFAMALADSELSKSIESLTQMIHQINHGEKLLASYLKLGGTEQHVSTLHKLATELKSMEDRIAKLTLTLHNIKSKEQTSQNLDFEIDEYQMKFDDLMIEAGACPLCGVIKQKGGHSCS
jgi:exonuclease SbcC